MSAVIVRRGSMTTTFMLGRGGLGGGEALVDDRMAPGEVGAGQDDEIGKLEVLVSTGNGIGTESAAMAGDRGGHAQARIGVDIGRADEALHQLVGDVVVLRQQLAGNVEGHRIGAMLGDRFGKAGGDKVKRLVPVGAASVDLRIKNTSVEVDGFGKRRALGTQASEVGGMIRIALDADCAVIIDPGDDAAADAAVGTGGLGFSGHWSSPRHSGVRGFHPLLSASLTSAPQDGRSGACRAIRVLRW